VTDNLQCLASFVSDTLVPRHSSNAVRSPDTHSPAMASEPSTVTSQTITELRCALAHMRSDDRNLWVKIGLALRCLGDTGRGLWIAWSQTSEVYDALDAARVWDSFGSPNIGYQVVFAEAQRRGWVNPGAGVAFPIEVPNFIQERNFSVDGKPWAQFVEECNSRTASPTNRSGNHRFELLNGAALAALPPQVWRISGVFPEQGLVSVYGPSGSGKSFIVLDMAAAIAEGRRWFGWRVKSARVVYVCLEGEAGFKTRILAWEKHHNRPLPHAFHAVLQPFRLMNSLDVRDLAEAVSILGPGVVVFIDTLNRAAPEADENSSKDAGIILAGAKELQSLISGLVVLISHTGKDPTKGLRGHSSLLAAMDATIEIARDGERRSARLAKSKDGKDGAKHEFRLEVLNLGHDEDGEAITSCVVVPQFGDSLGKNERIPSGRNQKIAWAGIKPLFAGEVPSARRAPDGGCCIELDAALRVVAPSLTCSPERRLERARAAIDALIGSGFLGHREGFLWQV
jgi:hypothetical protein